MSATTRDSAAALARGAARLFVDLGFAPLVEFTLADGRRIDVAALGPKGEIVFVEVKSGLDDFRSDRKWSEYLGWCDRLFFAVSAQFPRTRLPTEAGVIIADAFGAGIVAPAPENKLVAARRKAVTLRFARAAADRLARTGGLA